MSKKLIILYLTFILLPFLNAEIYLKDNLKKAQKDDYIVATQSKNYILLHIYDKKEGSLTIEEISVPQAQLSLPNGSWKAWVKEGAPHHTSWAMFEIDLATGSIIKFYRLTENGWQQTTQADTFLSTLLNLRLEKIPLHERKRVGPPQNDGPDRRSLWKPKVTFEGKTYSDVPFDAWETRWPKDNSELSGRLIEIFTPEGTTHYPAYFPYWLQVSGMIGKAKVRMIDSGSGLTSPCPALPQ